MLYFHDRPDTVYDVQVLSLSSITADGGRINAAGRRQARPVMPSRSAAAGGATSLSRVSSDGAAPVQRGGGRRA
jgi:hypothetical protein